MDGGRNCIKFSNVRRGEQVLLLAEPGVEQLGLEALTIAAKEVGADAFVLWKDKLVFGRPLAGIVFEAMKAADMVFDFGYPTVHTKEGWLANVDYGTKNLIVRPEAEVFASPAAKFPVELWYEIGKICQRRMREAGRVRVTDANGTDFSMRVRPGGIGAYIGPRPYEPGPAVPGFHGTFPPGTTVWGDIDYTANGTICLDAAYSFPRFDPPVRLTVEDGWVTRIDGPQADALRQLVDSVHNANRLNEMGFGMNPKVSLNFEAPTAGARIGRVLGGTRRAGTFFYGMGGNILLGGKESCAQPPIYSILTKPTVFAGDTLLVDNGHLVVLDLPEIQEFASRFGEPRQVLSYYAG